MTNGTSLVLDVSAVTHLHAGELPEHIPDGAVTLHPEGGDIIAYSILICDYGGSLCKDLGELGSGGLKPQHQLATTSQSIPSHLC